MKKHNKFIKRKYRTKLGALVLYLTEIISNIILVLYLIEIIFNIILVLYLKLGELVI